MNSKRQIFETPFSEGNYKCFWILWIEGMVTKSAVLIDRNGGGD